MESITLDKNINKFENLPSFLYLTNKKNKQNLFTSLCSVSKETALFLIAVTTILIPVIQVYMRKNPTTPFQTDITKQQFPTRQLK